MTELIPHSTNKKITFIITKLIFVISILRLCFVIHALYYPKNYRTIRKEEQIFKFSCDFSQYVNDNVIHFCGNVDEAEKKLLNRVLYCRPSRQYQERWVIVK